MNKLKLTPQVVSPAGRPTDIFTRTNGGAKLGQLAEGLAQFAPSLTRFALTVQEGKDQDAQLAGENAARELVEQGKTYKQAVQAGLIKPHQSPFFRMGAYETFGRASAWRYSVDMQVALARSPVAESTNPADFDKFEGEFRKTWAQEHLGDTLDPHFSSAFGRQADAQVEGLRHNFAESAGKRLVQQTGEAFHAEAYAILEDAHTKGLKPAEAAALLELAAKRQEAAGMNRSIVNQLLSSAIDAAAQGVNDGEGDAELLKVKHEIKLGTGSLAGTSYGSAGSLEAEHKIAAYHQSKLRAEAEEAKAKKQADLDAVTSDLVTALQGSKSPLMVDVNPFIERVKTIGEPDRATTLLNIQKAFADREYQDVPEVEQRLLIGVHTGYTNMARLDDALAAKSITFGTYSKLASDVKERDKTGSDKSATKQAEIERVRARAKSLFVAEFGDSSVEERYRAEQASAQVVHDYLTLLSSNEGQNLTQDQKEEWVHNAVIRQFGITGDKLNVDPVKSKRIPEADFSRPLPVNPKKAPATPPDTFKLIQQGFERVKQGGRYTSSEIAVLKSLGIMPKDVPEFLSHQKKFNP